MLRVSTQRYTEKIQRCTKYKINYFVNLCEKTLCNNFSLCHYTEIHRGSTERTELYQILKTAM